jgi:chemotaxis protein MotB
MIRRKPLDDDDESADRWLVSYADFITLLFAFFVVMYAISSVNLSKYNALTSSMGNAFTGKPQASSVVTDNSIAKSQPKTSVLKPLPLSYLYQKRSQRDQENMTKMGVDLANQLAPQITSGQLSVSQSNRGVRIDISDSVLFDVGSADLAPNANVMLDKIAEVLKSNQRIVQIEGHTDTSPIHTELFYSNWELSAVRATSVVRTMIDRGVDEKRLSGVGYGSTQPISTSDTEFGRASNRRVSVMILYDTQNVADDSTPIRPSLAPLVQQP